MRTIIQGSSRLTLHSFLTIALFTLFVLELHVSHGSSFSFVGIGLSGWNGSIESQECSSHCSISYDTDLTCWQSTLDYFERVLAGTMRHYILVQANRIVWSNRHQIAVDYPRMARESVKRMMHLTATEPRDANKLGTNVSVTRQIFKQLVPPFLTDAKHVVDALNRGDIEQLPVIHCAVGCERSWESFMWLFYASCTISIATLFALIAFTLLLDRREKKVVEAEAADYGDNAKTVVVDYHGHGRRDPSESTSN